LKARDGNDELASDRGPLCRRAPSAHTHHREQHGRRHGQRPAFSERDVMMRVCRRRPLHLHLHLRLRRHTRSPRRCSSERAAAEMTLQQASLAPASPLSATRVRGSTTHDTGACMTQEHDAAEASSAASEMTLHRKDPLTSISSQRGSLTRRAHRLSI